MDEREEKEILGSYKNSRAFWEEHFETLITLTHICSQQPEDNASKIMKCEFSGQNDKYWYFANVWLVTFYDVEVGEAEYVAEVLNSTMVIINFCPFCGKRLN